LSDIVGFCRKLSDNEPACKPFKPQTKKATQTSPIKNGNSTVVVLADKEENTEIRNRFPK
jgi:hypothetical protein